MFWNNGINIDVFGYFEYHIDATVTSLGHADWRLTCMYGEAQVSERYRTWDIMKSLVSVSPLPWLCLGDFNKVLRPSEHVDRDREGQHR